jgi:hypothetical protein
MRAVFLLLLLANALFFAYVQWVRAPEGDGALLTRLQIMPQSIRILDGGERGPATAAFDHAGACLEWSALTGADVARAEAAIEELQLPAGTVERAAEGGGYWVYLPPSRTREENEQRVRTLRAHGVRDLYVVQEAGPWRNAISLGIFRSEAAARTMVADLTSRGVAGIVLEHREQFLRHVVYRVREPDTRLVGRLTALQQAFPGTRLKAVACSADELAAPKSP